MACHAQQAVTVSVIMPVYNHARWVRQAIASVLDQTLTALELIIIDDASRDDSWQCIQTVCQERGDRRVQCLRHAYNRGAPATLNAGLQLARGDYLAILNSDDVWDMTRLERLLAVAVHECCDFVASDVALLDADGLPHETHEPYWVDFFTSLKRDYATQGDMLATLLRGNLLISTSNFFFHRRVWDRLGNFASWRYVHDYDFALRVVTAGFRVHFMPDAKLLGYRLHTSNTIREQPLAVLAENMQMLLAFLPQLHGKDVCHLQALQAQWGNLCRYLDAEWQGVVHRRLLVKEQELWPLITDRDRWIQERDGWIAQRDQTIAALEQDLQQHRHWLAERDGWVCERDGWVCERDGWIAQRDGWIRERDAWIAERDLLIRHLQQHQQVLYGSRAFRLGNGLLSPLRLLKRLWTGQEPCHAN